MMFCTKLRRYAAAVTTMLLLLSMTGIFAVELQSDTATPLNVSLYYTCEPTGNTGEYTVTVQLILHHYTIAMRAGHPVSVTVGDQTQETSLPALDSSDNAKLQQTVLMETAFICTTDADGRIPVTASFDFSGVYAGQQIDVITISGAIIPAE